MIGRSLFLESFKAAHARPRMVYPSTCLSDRVGHVDDTVADVSGQLTRIIEQVQQLSHRFESVNSGVEQQAVGAAQINGAMATLTDNARQSGVSLSEFASAANHLHESTATLERQIGRFKLAPESR